MIHQPFDNASSIINFSFFSFLFLFLFLFFVWVFSAFVQLMLFKIRDDVYVNNCINTRMILNQ